MKAGRLLVIDDSEALRLALEEHLVSQGYDVETVGGVAEGLAAAARRPPEVVITDLRLGDGTGLELIRRLSEGAESSAPAFILLTGYATLESAIEAIHHGADEYLLKPVELRDLDAALDGLLGRRRAEGGAQGRTAQEALRQVGTPLSLLRAYLDMLGEGRFGPLTEMQEDKIRQARDFVREIAALVRGAGRLNEPSSPRVRVVAGQLDQLFQGLFNAWSEDFERRGVQVAWSQPPAAGPMQADLAALKRDAEAFLADSLARAGMGMTLRLEWHRTDGHLSAGLRLDPAVMAHGGGVAAPALPLASLSFRLRYDG